MAERFRVGKPRAVLPRKAARYGQIAPSAPRSRSLWVTLGIVSVVAFAVWGGSRWGVQIASVEDAMFRNFHRAHPHKAKHNAETAPATNRADGRMAG